MMRPILNIIFNNNSKFKVILKIQKHRKLPLKGKITVLNSLALAPIINASSVVNNPNKAICKINNLIQNCIWDRTTFKISNKTLIQQIDKGDLNLCYYETKDKALEVFSIKTLTSEKDSTWKILPKYFYNLNTFFKTNHRHLSNTIYSQFLPRNS